MAKGWKIAGVAVFSAVLLLVCYAAIDRMSRQSPEFGLPEGLAYARVEMYCYPYPDPPGTPAVITLSRSECAAFFEFMAAKRSEKMHKCELPMIIWLTMDDGAILKYRIGGCSPVNIFDHNSKNMWASPRSLEEVTQYLRSISDSKRKDDAASGTVASGDGTVL